MFNNRAEEEGDVVVSVGKGRIEVTVNECSSDDGENELA